MLVKKRFLSMVVCEDVIDAVVKCEMVNKKAGNRSMSHKTNKQKNTFNFKTQRNNNEQGFVMVEVKVKE